jgi:hypothetical protein
MQSRPELSLPIASFIGLTEPDVHFDGTQFRIRPQRSGNRPRTR